MGLWQGSGVAESQDLVSPVVAHFRTDSLSRGRCGLETVVPLTLLNGSGHLVHWQVFIPGPDTGRLGSRVCQESL